MSASAGPARLYVPISQSDEVVAVAVDQLPHDPDEVLDVMKAEQAPLGLWLDLAKAYLSQGMDEQFLHILQEGATPEVENYYREAKYERIQVLCALAGHHISAFKNETNRKEKQLHQNKATGFLNNAGRIDPFEQLPWVGKGLLAIANGDLDAALKHFQHATSVSGQASAAKERGEHANITGLLGMACVCFNQKKFADALSFYKQALRKHPGAPAHVRLGLAACYIKLDNPDKARLCFERVLALDPESIDATVGIALLKLNSDGEGREALMLLAEAFRRQPRHPLMLNLLADHFFILDEFDKVRQLAQAAQDATENLQIRARSCYYQARTHHSAGEYEAAEKLYLQACQMDSSDPLPHYGLGQVYTRRGPGFHRNAIAEFEKVLASTAGNADAHKALGALYGQVDRTDARAKAVANLREAMVQSPCDVEMQVQLGELLSAGGGGANTAAEAIACFEKALGLCRSGKGKGERYEKGPTPELLNNTAVMMHMAGRLDEAEALYKEAAGVAAREAGAAEEGGEGAVDIDSVDLTPPAGGGAGAGAAAGLVTLAFNVGRLRESRKDARGAAALYRRVLAAQPQYLDCHIRLAAMARARGDLEGAARELEGALEAAKGGAGEGSANARAALGQVGIEAHDWDGSKKSFDSIKAEASSHHDAYATLGIANINFYTTPQAAKGARGGEVESMERHLIKALELYHRVLQREPRNYWAANGVGAVLATRGRLAEAKEVFTLVQESSAADTGVQMPDVWVNLAHVLLAQGQFISAIKMYQNVLRKFYHNQSADIMLCLARAHYDFDKMQESKRVLLKAMHLDPTNHQLRFDLAVAMQEFSVRTLKKDRREGDTRKLPEFEEAVEELGMAGRFFKFLSKMCTSDPKGMQKLDITEKKTAAHLQFCVSTLAKAQQYVEHARIEDQRANASREAQKARQEAAEEANRALEEARKQEMEANALEQEARAAEHAEKLKAMKAQWLIEDQMPGALPDGEGKKKKKKGGGGGGGDAFLDDDAGLADEAKEGQLVVRKGKGGKKEGKKEKAGLLSAAGLDSSSEEEEEEEEPEADDKASDEEEDYKSGASDESGGEEGGEGGGKEKKPKKDKAARKAEKKAAKAAAKEAAKAERAAAKAAKEKKRNKMNALIEKKRAAERDQKLGALRGRVDAAEEAEALANAEAGGKGKEAAGGEDAAGEGEGAEEGGGRKLKRAEREEGGGAEEAAGLEDDDELEDGDGSGGEEGAAGPSRKRARRAAIADSDEDDEDDGGAGGAGAAPMEEDGDALKIADGSDDE